MRQHLYNAAGNRILWIDGGGCGDETHCDRLFDQLSIVGAKLAQECQFDQELTAVLFASPKGLLALFWNPDGTEEDLCGNAIRCVPHFIAGESILGAEVSITTRRGTYIGRAENADYGSVLIPARTIRVGAKETNGDIMVDSGSPHRIRLVERGWTSSDLDDAMVMSTGTDPVNFDLVQRIGPFHFRARIFERGVGETRSCGTGAAAIVVALGEFALGDTATERPHLVHFASGEKLIVTYRPDADAFEIGGAVELLSTKSPAIIY